jgi:hypothetical protein
MGRLLLPTVLFFYQLLVDLHKFMKYRLHSVDVSDDVASVLFVAK